MWPIASSVSRSVESDLSWLAREPSGTPSRYLSVSIPCASGENAMQPAPTSVSVSSRPSVSTQRLSIEYDGWWMSSGVPRSREDPGRVAGELGGVRRDADVQRLAGADDRVERAHRLLERRRGVRAVVVEDVDVVEAHPPQGLVEAGDEVLPGAADLAVRPRPHVPAGLAGDDQLVAQVRGSRRAGAGRSSPRPRRTAGRSCWPGRSG